MTSLSDSTSSKFIVFSYNKKYEQLVLRIYRHLKNENLPVWIQVEDELNVDVYANKENLAANIAVLICFMTPTYQTSQQSRQEVLLIQKQHIPIIACRILPNWKPSGWLNKITSDLWKIDLTGINDKNFNNRVNRLREKLRSLSDKNSTNAVCPNSPVDQTQKGQSTVLGDSDIYSLIERSDEYDMKKKPSRYVVLPSQCRSSVSNVMFCNDEYILINANGALHLFDANLRLVRSSTERKIKVNDLKDLSWSAPSNCFIVLTRKQIYLMNPLTCKLSPIENMKLKESREEFVSCCCFQDRLLLVTCQLKSNLFYIEEFFLPTFRFARKFSVIELLDDSLVVQNGCVNNFSNIEEILSIRHCENKLAMTMRIASNWFLYLFRFDDQPVFIKKILLEDRSRIAMVNSIHQMIIFKDYLTNSFIQMPMDFDKDSQADESSIFSKAVIDFNGQLRCISLFRMSNLVLLIDNALLIYRL